MQTFLLIPVTILLLIGTGLSVQAEVKSLTVTVDGLACPFCAYGLEKKLMKVEGVEQLEIDVDAGEALLSVVAGTRLVATSGGMGNVSTGLVKDVQQAVEEAGFTPRDLRGTIEGNIVHTDGTTRLTVSGTGEILLLEEDGPIGKLQRFAGDHPVQVSGTIHPQQRMTVEDISSTQTTAAVCRLQISGMVCTGCVEALQTELESQQGVETASIDLETGIAEITVAGERLSPEALVDLVNTLEMEGMPAGTFKATALKE